MRPRFAVLLGAALAALTIIESTGVGARPRVPLIGVPLIRLIPAPEIWLNGDVDSNSPSVWDLVDGVPRLHVFTSTAGVARRSEGDAIETLSRAADVAWLGPTPQQGTWMEAVVADEQGVWYGYYHNERAGMVCGDTGKVLPRVGAARSTDRGLTWEDLGPILEGPPGTAACETTNHFFHGGVGDVSVMLDDDHEFLYLFYSQYLTDITAQGIAVARLTWAGGDEPQGGVEVWSDGAWLPPAEMTEVEENGQPREAAWVNAVGTPLFPTSRSWHDPEGITDAYWGAAVHWNTYLSRYVMLLNRSQDVTFTQQGIYAAFNETLDPSTWSPPRLVLNGGRWYPQVMGLGEGGTDKFAGQAARFFMSGQSTYIMQFLREVP